MLTRLDADEGRDLVIAAADPDEERQRKIFAGPLSAPLRQA